MSDALNNRRVAILATDGVERVELEQPRQAVEGAGAQVELLSIHDGEIAARNNDLEDAGTFSVDVTTCPPSARRSWRVRRGAARRPDAADGVVTSATSRLRQ